VSYFDLTSVSLASDGYFAGNQVGFFIAHWDVIETAQGVYDISSVINLITAPQNAAFTHFELNFDIIAPPPVGISRTPSFYQILNWSQKVQPFSAMATNLINSIVLLTNIHYVIIGNDIDYFFWCGNNNYPRIS